MESDSYPGVRTVSARGKSAAEKNGLEATVKLVENPRSGETMVEQFDVDTSKTQAELDWEPTWSIEETIHEQLSSK